MTTTTRERATATGRAGSRPTSAASRPSSRDVSHSTVLSWARAQALNIRRHQQALRPFGFDEFGTGPASPSPGHIGAVNKLITDLSEDLRQRRHAVEEAARSVETDPRPPRLREVVTLGERAHRAVRTTEQVWDWYFEFFGQRQSRFGGWLLACDRIALDVYQDVYMGLGRKASIPAPAPMCYMRTGRSPATFRRQVRLRRLAHQLNPFPIVQLPYHRLVNPWTLGAILHEVGHNLQNELGMANVARESVSRRLQESGLPASVVQIYSRWHRETFADLIALLLGGPSVVASLIDILGNSPRRVATYSPSGVHPLPLLRTIISTELLARMGFKAEAGAYRRLWNQIYAGVIPAAPASLITTAGTCIPLVVDTICYRSYKALGNRSLAGVFSFSQKHQAMVSEAAHRLAKGNDPGIVPERFIIGAARHALDHRLATPAQITAAFYRDLARR